MIHRLLRRWFHSSKRLGPFYISVWNWEQQHELCCRGRHLRAMSEVELLREALELLMRGHEKEGWSVRLVVEWARAGKQPPDEWAPAAKELWRALVSATPQAGEQP